MSDAFARAAFRDGPVEVESHGRTFSFDPLWAGAWMSLLPSPGWAASLLQRHCATPHRDRFLDMLEDGHVQPEDLVSLGRSVLAEAAGRPWWEAERLVATALTPEVLGAVLSKGIQPDLLTLAAFLAVTEAVIRERLDDTGRLQFESQISAPPPEALEQVPEEDLSAVMERLRGMTGARIG